MKTASVRIEGISALLMRRFAETEEISEETRTMRIEDEDPRDVARRYAYLQPDGTLYIPGAGISRMLRDAGASHKQRGSRKSLKYIVPAAVVVVEEAIPLLSGDGKSPAKNFEIDSRPVTIPATKGRVIRHRPRLNRWAAEFSIEIDDELLGADVVHRLLSEGGRRIGIGDFRPEKGGPFGRFIVTNWELQ